MADSLDAIATELEAATAKGEDLKDAVGKLLTKTIKQHKRIIFNGNGYSAEWQKEAAKRGLLNLKNSVDALPEVVTPAAIKLLDRFKILNEREVHARYEIFLENYNKTINIEGQLMVLMANRYILPAAFEYQKQIGQSVAAVKAGGGKSAQGKKLLGDLHEAGGQAEDRDRRPGELLEHGGGSARSTRKFMRDNVVPDGQAARDGRQHRGVDAARAGRCRRIGRCCSSSRRGGGRRQDRMRDGPASVPARRVLEVAYVMGRASPPENASGAVRA
jgi:glutamine synthetase